MKNRIKITSIAILLFATIGCSQSELKTTTKDSTYGENHKRAELVAQALSKKKIYNSVVFFDERKKLIQIELMRPTNAKAPSLEDLMGIIKEELKQSSLRKEAQFIKKSDIDLKIIRGEGEIMILE